MKVKYINYIGPDIILEEDHIIERYRGKKVLSNNKIYKLGFDWDTIQNFNNFWTFYIYDDLCDGEYRGYEININHIETIRNHNIDYILDSIV